MPINVKGGVRYRVKTTKSGKRVRLAFTKGGKVVEAKNIDSGAIHTPAEFAKDRKGRSKTRKKVRRSGMKAKLVNFVRKLRKK
jgi:hypothetical protein